MGSLLYDLGSIAFRSQSLVALPVKWRKRQDKSIMYLLHFTQFCKHGYLFIKGFWVVGVALILFFYDLCYLEAYWAWVRLVFLMIILLWV